MSELHPTITQVIALRKAANVSRASVARQIHYCRPAVGNWEAGVSVPCLDAVDAYARLFGHRLALGDATGPVMEALVRARLDTGLSQAAVARRLGRAVTSVGRWEMGHRRPSLTSVDAYAALFGLELRVVSDV